MKKFILSALICMSLAAQAQKEKTPAAPGVVYGVVTEGGTAVTPEEIKAKSVNDQFQGQIKATVVEVCKAEGCWIKVARKKGDPIMVRVKDHAFLMPENIVGKTVVIEGTATVKETSESQLKHYAEDAGKSKEEIAKIKGGKTDVQVSATGVKVIQ